jgi:hypothetical protein
MVNVFICILSYGLNPLVSDSLPTLKTLISKGYTVEVKIQRTEYSKIDSFSKPIFYLGQIKRSANYVFSNIDFGIGILEDSTCFYMEKRNKTVVIGGRKLLGTLLVAPFFDPYEIFAYAGENNTLFQKYLDGDILVYEYVFLEKDDPVRNITFAFNRKEEGKFQIRLVYKQRSHLVKDMIDYFFVSNAKSEGMGSITHFLDYKDGKYVLRPDFQSYTLYDYTLPLYNNKRRP